MSGSNAQQIAVLKTQLNALNAQVASLTTRLNALTTRLNATDVKVADHEKRTAHLELIVYGDPGTGVAVVPP